MRKASTAFTIIELLITLAVVTLLAAIVALVAAGALEQARVERSRAQVRKCYELLSRRWGEYASRPLPVRIPPHAGGKQAAKIRLDFLRETMRLEFPDRRSDIDPRAPGYAVTPGRILPSAASTYQRRIVPTWTDQYQSAECLYLILTATREGDGTALDNFKPSEIGDVDGDGMHEVLDAWGEPIRYIRWAPAYRSPLQDGDPAVSPDPFDPFRVYGARYALWPVIYSAGPDGVPGFNHQFGHAYAGASPPNNPYSATHCGEQGEGATDDIINHLLE